MDVRRQVHSLAKKSKANWAALAFAAVLLACGVQAMRNVGSAPAIREKLIGTWKLVGIVNAGIQLPIPKLPGADAELHITLNADGTALFLPGNERGTWYMEGDRSFHTVLAEQDDLVEIVSLSPNRLVTRQFDYESDAVYERVKSPD